MKALSIKQPFAGLIATGQKTLETRTQKCHHRGDLLICASKAVADHGWIADVNLELEEIHLFGMAICAVQITGCRPMIPEDETAACCGYRNDLYVYELSNVRKIKPFHVKGQLGLFNVSESLIIYPEIIKERHSHAK